MDSSRVESYIEGPEGMMQLIGASNVKGDQGKAAELRCRVTVDDVDYTSPYFNIQLLGEKTYTENEDKSGTTPRCLFLPHHKLKIDC